MKKGYIIGGLLGLLLAAGVYYTSYRLSLNMYGEEQEQNSPDSVQADPSYVAADTNKEQRITNRTAYTLEFYNAKDYELEEKSEPMPENFIGLNREEMIAWLEEYESAPSLEDQEMGFESVKLVSFSNDHIVLRKTYYPYEERYKYYLISEGGRITVYYADKKTVYEYTNIKAETLPENLQEELEKGKYITEMGELYNFLENYSS